MGLWTHRGARLTAHTPLLFFILWRYFCLIGAVPYVRWWISSQSRLAHYESRAWESQSDGLLHGTMMQCNETKIWGQRRTHAMVPAFDFDFEEPSGQ